MVPINFRTIFTGGERDKNVFIYEKILELLSKFFSWYSLTYTE